jgi:alkanesulfonate monooxygenase SsuD/methylene tetrahydromethanopterin reductase-like flavin-dependent oxidoreductase (luciferase family)
MTPRQFEHLAGPRGALVLGSPDEVIEKILYEHALFGHQRFLMQIDLGMTDHRQIMRAIELYGTVVAPAVRRALGVVAVPA